MDKLTVTLKTVTPLFLGGADPNEKAELRAPSIKGALRFWYRAIDPEYNQKINPAEKNSPTWEEKIFGSVEHGQGCFLMTLREYPKGEKGFDKEYYKGFKKGDGTHSKNGVIYLSYSLETGDIERGNYQQRKYIDINEPITFELLFKKYPDDKTRNALLSSLWMLIHIGGLGFRARRVFGTVSLQEITVEGKEWPEIKKLFPDEKIDGVDAWLSRFVEGLRYLELKESNNSAHTVLSANSRIYLLEESFSDSGKYKGWEHALNCAGRVMQDFRNRRSPDYLNVKNHFAKKEEARLSKKNPPETPESVPGVTPAKLSTQPERAYFGLPLAFQYQSLKKANYQNRETTFQGTDHDRSASPVFMRLVKINGKYHPFFALLNAPLLAPNEEIKENSDKDSKFPKSIISSTILDDFCKCLAEKSVGKKELKW